MNQPEWAREAIAQREAEKAAELKSRQEAIPPIYQRMARSPRDRDFYIWWNNASDEERMKFEVEQELMREAEMVRQAEMKAREERIRENYRRQRLGLKTIEQEEAEKKARQQELERQAELEKAEQQRQEQLAESARLVDQFRSRLGRSSEDSFARHRKLVADFKARLGKPPINTYA